MLLWNGNLLYPLSQFRWTPVSGTGDQWGSQPSSILGGSGDWSSNDQPGGTQPNTGQGGITSVMSSRRSSLRSISYMELEGIGLADSPGPNPTEDPLPGIRNQPGSSGGSRRSSLSSSLMPEVVVTRQRGSSPPPTSPKPPQDESRLTAPEANKIRIWNLLPVSSKFMY